MQKSLNSLHNFMLLRRRMKTYFVLCLNKTNIVRNIVLCGECMEYDESILGDYKGELL